MSSQAEISRKKMTLPRLQAKSEQGEPITVVTAYDYSSGLLADASGIDLLLVEQHVNEFSLL